jgi:hypothetical protein
MKANMFKVWMELMKFNGKEVGKAGSLIGLGTRETASAKNTGKSEVNHTELLAMSAVAAGLKPWSPEYHPHLVAVKEIQTMIEVRASELAASRSPRSAKSSPSHPAA